jgi:hypothetical protein
MRTLLILSLVLSTLTPTLALAQEDGAVRTETFTDADQVTGTLQSPEGTGISVRRRMMRHTLITPRAHYTSEMLRSVENL